MKLIVCVEDRFGMLFNCRRVSRDSAVSGRILSIANGEKIWTDPYSAELFPSGSVAADTSFLEKAKQQEYCFLEKTDIRPWIGQVDTLILFRWNRKYPFDQVFPFAEFFSSWRLIRQEDFPGNSHERITMEVYKP